MAYKIAFFGAKPYDIASFDKVNEKYNYDIRYYKGHLNPNNVVLTQDTDAVCIFVNDTADAAVIDAMVDNGVKLLALRCAGFNNVDLKAAKGKLPVVRVPAYSPYAVAEYSLALMLSLNRKIHRAYWRTRDGNFSLNGLMGFDMHGKTIGIIGTGKIARILIRLLKGFGMRILAYDLYPGHEVCRRRMYFLCFVRRTVSRVGHHLLALSADRPDKIYDRQRLHRQDEGRRNDHQYRPGPTDQHQRPDRRPEGKEDRGGRSGRVRGGGRILL